MKTADHLLKEIYPSKDYNKKLKEQFSYYDMMQFSIRVQLQQLENDKV